MARRRSTWMQEHVSDPYVQMALAQGYRSRAAFKLLEIADRDRLLRPGMLVADLGAAPGSWSQVMAARVRPGGQIFAVDILDMDPIPGVEFIRGDFGDEAVAGALETALRGRKLQLVVSDMAPNISGVAASDQARAIRLCELALDFAVRHLEQEGSMLVKVFQGSGYPEFLAELRRRFRTVLTRKPKASRGRSSEMYLLGKGLKEK